MIIITNIHIRAGLGDKIENEKVLVDVLVGDAVNHLRPNRQRPPASK